MRVASSSARLLALAKTTAMNSTPFEIAPTSLPTWALVLSSRLRLGESATPRAAMLLRLQLLQQLLTHLLLHRVQLGRLQSQFLGTAQCLERGITVAGLLMDEGEMIEARRGRGIARCFPEVGERLGRLAQRQVNECTGVEQVGAAADAVDRGRD